VEEAVAMSEPMKIILIMAGICSGMYFIGLLRNIAYTGRVNPDYVFPVFFSFIIVVAVGFLIWGIVTAFQSSGNSRKKKRA